VSGKKPLVGEVVTVTDPEVSVLVPRAAKEARTRRKVAAKAARPGEVVEERPPEPFRRAG
jgi:hypothetical protein